MFNTLLEEMAVETLRKDRMALAAAYNSIPRGKESVISLSFYQSLEKFGALLENWAVKMQNRNNCLAVQEKRDMLANSVE